MLIYADHGFRQELQDAALPATAPRLPEFPPDTPGETREAFVAFCRHLAAKDERLRRETSILRGQRRRRALELHATFCAGVGMTVLALVIIAPLAAAAQRVAVLIGW